MPAASNTAPRAPRTPTDGGSWFRRYRWAIIGLVIAAACVVILAPAASEDPDGLDRVSEDKGFAQEGQDSGYEILPDYSIPGVDNEWVSVVLSGLVGVAIVFAVILVLGFLLQQTRKGARAS
ncbi:MAG: PDGLE domain-containing protein [Dehalococcoidia bacterium]|nr:PDGLE domain-containing protein [Dehalococcoidia bacterium]